MDAPGPPYIFYNGEYLHGDKPFLGLPNRAFYYGDAIMEELHAYATEPQFLDAHLEKLVSAMDLLSMDVPEYFNIADLNLFISKLLRKNRLFGGAAVRITVFRNSSELFAPQRNDVSFAMDCRRLEQGFYALNSAGYVIDVYQESIRHVHPLSSIRNADPLLFIKAAQYCEKKKLDDCVFLNGNRRIVETVYSSIFLVKDQAVFTPSVHEGCIPGVMRKVMVDLCSMSGFRNNDQSRLSPEAMEEADEIFLADAVNGLRWVGAYRQKRYYKKSIQKLLAALNQLAFEKWNRKD